MTVKEAIETSLKAALKPQSLEVTDESSKHKGHAGSRPSGETHFRVHIISAAFEGLNSVKRHQLVYRAIGTLMGAPIHALAIEAKTPKEAA